MSNKSPRFKFALEENMTGYVTRRCAFALLAAASCLAAGTAAQAQDSIKIGYAISKTGPNTGGASITTLPNYQLWVKEVNAAGGIMLNGKRVPIEVVEYDDRSNSEEAVKAVERLATQDKVDFILPPWSTGLNLAVAPVMNRLGYPHLAVTTNTDRAPELAKRWPNASFWLGLPSDISTSFVDVLNKMKAKARSVPTWR
jgi:branched-chain amino acid transport system substrate-binding protein